MIHHPRAFATFSVIGGAVLIAGTFVLYLNGGQSTNPSAAVRPVGSAVRGTPGADQTATPSAASAAQATATPGRCEAMRRRHSSAIDVNAEVHGDRFTRRKGDVTLRLDPKAAPIAVNNFVFLAQNQFYDGLSFQRVVPGFIAQAGAPSPDGSGGPGYTIQDENSPLKHTQGAVATGGSGLDLSIPQAASSTSCWLPRSRSQDGKDTVFGNVTAGLNILQALPALRSVAIPGTNLRRS